jgi:Metallo-peptidase family M12B Reprolysin-like/IPT/TIG domain
VLRTLLHEFGHAVGLHHEHERRDASNCDDGDVGSGNSESVTIGSYDPQSVMNYCAIREEPVFTSGDIQGINHLFPGDDSGGGDPPTTPPSNIPTLGSIAPGSVQVGSRARTLTVNGANFNANTRIMVEDTKLYPTVVSSQQITARLSSSWFTSARTLTIRVYDKSSSGPRYASGHGRLSVAR